MSTITRGRSLVHAFVECRTRGTPWWLYTRPMLPPDDAMSALLVGQGIDDREEDVRALGVPIDVSLAVRDEYTWRVAGPTGGDAPNIVAVDEAQRWLQRGVSRRWTTSEPFVRVVDPRWSHATWFDRTELSGVIDRYEDASGHPAPAAYCALLAMMAELERDFVVRVVLWLEQRMATDEVPLEPPALFLRDHLVDLERARAHVRSRRRRERRAMGREP